MADLDIDWPRLRHAFGTCEQFPEALEALFSDDAQERKAAYWKLDNYVVVQGDLYEPAPYVVRALNALLRRPGIPKAEAYDLLLELALGAAPESRVVSLDGRVMSVESATLESLVNGAHIYLEALRDNDSHVRLCAAAVLVELVGKVEIDVAAVRSALERETDDEAREGLTELLADVARTGG